MNKELVKQISALFKARHIARELNISGFPYSDTGELFKENLKLYLSSLFGEEIRFDREETFAYVQAHYKDVPIEINTWEGIILTIEDVEREDVVRELMEVFSGIFDLDPICRYNFCSKFGCNVTVYPTIEWHLNPEKRLDEIVKGFMVVPGTWIRDMEDYHTGSVIESLGTDLFTFEGYKKMFNSRCNDYKNVRHRVNQIQRLNPNLDTEVIYAWIRSCKKTMDVSKDSVKQKVYMDDGK